MAASSQEEPSTQKYYGLEQDELAVSFQRTRKWAAPRNRNLFLTINTSPEKHRQSGITAPKPTSISKGLVESRDLCPRLPSLPSPTREIGGPKGGLCFNSHPREDRCLVPFPQYQGSWVRTPGFYPLLEAKRYLSYSPPAWCQGRPISGACTSTPIQQ